MAFRGCIARPTSDLVGIDITAGTTVIGMGTEIVDPDSIHDTVTNNSRFTIPAGLNGLYGIFTAQYMMTANSGSPTNMIMRIQKNGTTQDFVNEVETLSGVDSDGTQPTFVSTAPVQLVTSDFWEMILQNQSSVPVTLDHSINIIAAQTSFSLVVIG